MTDPIVTGVAGHRRRMVAVAVVVLVAVGTAALAPANAGDEPKAPIWSDEARLSTTQLMGTWFLFWPTAHDDGEVVEYVVRLNGEDRTRVGAGVRMAMVSTNSPADSFEVVAVDGAGNRSAPLTVNGAVEPLAAPLPRLTVRIIERVGVDGGIASSDSRDDIDSSTSLVMPPVTLPTTAPSPTTTAPSTTAPTTSVPSASSSTTTFPTSTVPTSTSEPDTDPAGSGCGPDIVIDGLPVLSSARRTHGPVAVLIPAGRYAVTALSHDIGHAPGVQVQQTEERWSARSDTDWELAPVPDLPDADQVGVFELGEMDVETSISALYFDWRGVPPRAHSVQPELRFACVEPDVEIPGVATVTLRGFASPAAPPSQFDAATTNTPDADADGIDDSIDRWPYEASLLDASEVPSVAFAIGDLLGRLSSRDRGELSVVAAADGVRLRTRQGDRIVDAVLCSRGLAGGETVIFRGDLDATVSCHPFSISLRAGTASVVLPDGHQIDVGAGSEVRGELRVDGRYWWSTPMAGPLVLRDPTGASGTLVAGPDDPWVVNPATR